MDITPPPIDLPTLQRMSRRFSDFAARDGQDDVLYAAMARHIADDPSLCGLLAHAPATQQLPVLLLAALHDRVLDARAPRHALHDYYPTASGHRRPDAALPGILKAFVQQEREAVLRSLRTRTTQTNEAGRCAVLRVALQRVAELCAERQCRAATGRPLATGDGAPEDGQAPALRRLALFDFGCSAGLNLAVQDYAYEDGWSPWPAASPEAPVISTAWRRAPADALRGPRRWQVVDRLGVDLAPVSVDDPDATRWLKACLWPHDALRGARLRQALVMARRQPPRLVRSTDGLAVLQQWLQTLPPGVQPVLVNTWVLAYFDDEGRRAYEQAVATLVREHGLMWISAEAGKFAAVQALPPPSEDDPATTTTLWTLQWRCGGDVRGEALAWSHAHGKWADWLEPLTSSPVPAPRPDR